jgi:four helix bundle protein
MEPQFDHEKLKVYQKSLVFNSLVIRILEDIPKHSSLHDQLERASISITLNIAEGNGKWSRKDRCRYFDIARGSALECAAALDLAAARKFFSADQTVDEKDLLAEIVRMLVGLIQANDSSRSLRKGEFRIGEDEAVPYTVGEKEKD